MKFLKKYFIKEYYIKQRFVYYFEKNIIILEPCFKNYKNEIINTSLFLYISLFHLNGKQQRYIHFDWVNYLKTFSSKSILLYLNCATKYVFENIMAEKHKKVLLNWPNNGSNFRASYLALCNKKAWADINFNNYLHLISGSLVISDILSSLDKQPENTAKLVDYSSKWRQQIFMLFGNKAEYILFTFFYNLNTAFD